jgi:hypothetical protein
MHVRENAVTIKTNDQIFAEVFGATMAQDVPHSQFKAGSGSFQCEACGKKTRDTGNHEAELRLCKSCIDKFNAENSED